MKSSSSQLGENLVVRLLRPGGAGISASRNEVARDPGRTFGMPELDGFELAAMIRDHPRFPRRRR